MNALAPCSGACTVHRLVVFPHPLVSDGQRSEAVVLAAGDTLASMLDRAGVAADGSWMVELQGVTIPPAMWPYTRPKDRTVIVARRLAQKSALRLIATVALMVYGGPIASFLGVTSKIGIALVQIAGSLLINRLLGPPRLKAPEAQTVSPTYSVSASRNSARLFEPMGLVLGEPYAVPDLASQAFTYFGGEDAYLTQIFHCGVNCASVRDVRIGQTAISLYEGVTMYYGGFTDIADTGLPDGSVDTVAGALLDAPVEDGPWVTRTSSPNTGALGIDLEASLYWVTGSGAYRQLDLRFQAEYRAVGSPTWLPVLGTDSNIIVSGASTKPRRWTYHFAVAVGQYEVRLRKGTVNATASDRQNALTWTALRSYQVDTGVYAGQARFGVNIKASGQLNGALDEVNAVLRARSMPLWNGVAWVTAATRESGLCNPGAIFLLLARGIWDGGTLLAGLGWDDSRIDVEGLKAFMVRCAAKGFTFDLYLQEATSIDDLLDAVAYAGLATKSWHSGKLGVIWLSEAAPIEGVINMATTKARSFSVEYNTGDTTDELVLSYLDRARGYTWQAVRVVAPGVVTPTKSSQIRLLGVSDESQAAVIARFAMAQNVYMRKSIALEQDLEHMAYRRGSVLALSHDLTQWGYGGRLQGAVNAGGGYLTLTLDDVVPAVGAGGATSRFIGLRVSGEAQFRVFGIAAFAGTSRTVTLTTPWPGGVSVPGDLPSNPAHDCLWIYDFKSTPGQRVVVTAIEPRANMGGASVSLSPMPDEFWPYVWTGAYSPPGNQSQLQPLPSVSNVRIGEQLNRQGGSFYCDLTASWDVAGSYLRTEVWGSLGNGEFAKLGESAGRSFTWAGGLEESWVIELRPFSILGRPGPRVQQAYAVQGLSAPPPAPATVALSQDFVFWSTVDYVALAGYVVRTALGSVEVTAANFARATPLFDGVVQSSPQPITRRLYGIQTVMVATMNANSVPSTPIGATLDFGQPDASDVVQVMDFAALGFPGVLTNCSVVGGVLMADADPASDVDALTDLDTEPDLDSGLYLPMTWISQAFVPSYGGGTLTLDYAGMAGSTQSVSYRVDGDPQLDVDAMADLDTTADLDGGSGSEQPWPGALPVTRAQGVQYVVRIAGGAQRGMVPAFTASLAAQRASQIFSNVAIPASGMRLAPSAGVPPVTWIRVLSLGYMNVIDGSGAFGARVNNDFSPSLGPLVELVNSTGAAIDSRATIEVKGLIDA